MKRAVLSLSDELFQKMIQVELEECYPPVTVGDFSSADLFICDVENLGSIDIPAGSAILGIASGDEPISRDYARMCRLILHRPFAITTFRSELDRIFKQEEPSTMTRIIMAERKLLCNGEEISFSPIEDSLFRALSEAKGQFVDFSERMDKNNLQVHLAHIRKKIAGLPITILSHRSGVYSLKEQAPILWEK